MDNSVKKWKKWAVYLALFTIIYNLIEAVIAIYWGISDDSISLAGFGGDSLVEVGSAVLVLWNLNNKKDASTIERERLATRGIASLFILLSIIVFSTSSWQLSLGKGPETTLPGVIISCISILVMIFLWFAKVKAAKVIKSLTLEKDAACTLICIRLSAVLLIGSMLYTLFPSFWWVDSVFAIVLGLLILKEGIDTMKETYKEDFSGGCGCD